MSIGRAITVSIAFLCAGVSVVHAQTAERHGSQRRTLGAHRFQPARRLPDALVTTHVRTATGAGFATGFESPFINVDGDTLGSLKGDLAFFFLQIEYQQNLFDRGALRVEVSGTGRAGVDEQSILADGLTTIYGVVVAGKVAVLQRQRSQVAVIATFSRKNLFSLDPFGFAQRVVDNGGLGKDNALVLEGDVHRYLLGAAGMHAPYAWLGLNAFFEVGSAHPVTDSAKNETLFNAGLAGDLDLGPLRGWPVGFLLGYDYDAFPEGGADVAKGIHSGTFGINYTGREDFHLGLETVLSTLKQTDIESTLSSTSFLLNLRYYF